jgi:hypothetical protein
VSRTSRRGGIAKKTYRQRKTNLSRTRSATAERAAVPHVAKRRILRCEVIGIRDHPRERIADRICDTVWQCQILRAAEAPRKVSVFRGRVTPRIKREVPYISNFASLIPFIRGSSIQLPYRTVSHREEVPERFF